MVKSCLLVYGHCLQNYVVVMDLFVFLMKHLCRMIKRISLQFFMCDEIWPTVVLDFGRIKMATTAFFFFSQSYVGLQVLDRHIQYIKNLYRKLHIWKLFVTHKVDFSLVSSSRNIQILNALWIFYKEIVCKCTGHWQDQDSSP